MLAGLSGGAYVRLLSAVYAATFLIRVAFGVVLVTFAAYTDTSHTTYGLLISASPLLELFTILFIGPVIDKHGGKRILLAGLVLGAISLIGLAFTRNVFVLGFFNGIHGVAAAAILVPTLAIIAEVAPEKHRGREMGTFNFVNMFGWFGGFALGYVMLDVFRDAIWITFLIAGALALAGFVWALFNIRERWRGIQYDHAISIRTFGGVLRERAVMFLGIPWLIVFLFIAALISFQGKVLGVFSGTATAGAVGLIGTVFVASQILYGKLSDMYGRNPFILTGAVGFVGLMLVVAYASTTSSDIFAELARLWWAITIFVLAALAFPPAALAALADVAQYLPKGITMSVYTLAVSLGFIIGPTATGLIFDIAEARGGPGAGQGAVLVFFVALSIALLVTVLIRFVDSKGGIAIARRIWLRE